MENYAMKNTLKRLVPLILAICIVICVGWYLFVYDRTFTRDILLNCARYFDGTGSAKAASVCYDMAYRYSGNDVEVAIELANQYKRDGNYTKAEVTLTNAISDGGSAELYKALCKTYVQQDKLLDAVHMLDSIGDAAIKAELEAQRPAAPTTDPEPGFYSQYISVALTGESGTLYCSTDGDYPSTRKDLYISPITLGAGETTLYAVAVADNGLVSPVSIYTYTVGGVIEAVEFTDTAMEAVIRTQLGVSDTHKIYTNELWDIKEFTVPQDAQSLEDLKYLTYLEKLTVQNQQLSSLSSLSGLTKLTEIDLSGSRFPSDDLEILAQLPALAKLNLSNCGLSTVAKLANALSLTSLNLSSNTVRNLDALTTLPMLQELQLQHNAVMDLSALSALTELDTLDISYNSVSDLAPLAGCTKLTHLNASNNSLTALAALDQLPVLQYLNLSYNEISDISILKTCMELTELHISNNKLVNIVSLNEHSKLEVLDFSYNDVYEIPLWSEGGALRNINGSHNHIDDIDTLWRMENLSYVYMDYNNITSIGLLAKCPNLVMVNVYGNDITTVNALTEKGIIVNWDPT